MNGRPKQLKGAEFLGKTDYRHKPTPCLGCGKLLDAATGLNHDNNPCPGDVSICFSCGHIQVYADDLSFRELNDEEMVDIAGDKRIVEFQTIRAMAMKEKENSK